jgi:molybdopterin synthase sulfur carrier subunit
VQITILFFSFARERMKRDRWELLIPEGTDIASLYHAHLQQDLVAPMSQWMFSVNEVWADPHQVLRAGDVVAVIPPVSGG